ncbi:MAG: hypothetical protein KC613_26485, partial [Myxococcales bacterium]|nr:hypothetical protein [Myxococcales bacterium]
PTRWSLPFPMEQDGRGVFAGLSFGLVDLARAGAPDLVLYRDDLLPDGDPLAGRAYWRIHANTGGGFAAEGARWALPVPLEEAATGIATGGHGVLSVQGCPALFFFDDDERPEPDPLIGRAYWLYHP